MTFRHHNIGVVVFLGLLSLFQIVLFAAVISNLQQDEVYYDQSNKLSLNENL